ncbi:MAG: folate-binding protein YgfZ [Gemmatimonadaceae bacterium]|nr:folate-binding protein YgfZ [Gemmatimonadaceae bacterium]
MNIALSNSELAAYAALRTQAVWFSSPGVWSAFRGAKAVDALNGLVTNDVAMLAVGSSLYAAALTPKGKMIADLLIVRDDATSFLIQTMPAVAPAWLALARKYVNPRLCTVSDESDRYRSWIVVGARAFEAMEGMTFDQSLQRFPAPPMGGMSGFLLLADATQESLVCECLASTPMAMGTATVWDVLRVEAGRPEMGVDMDEDTIPQEANLDTLGAISFSKGCYTGQETVARVHFRGHVNKRLRGLIADGPMRPGDEVADAGGKAIGSVRSTAQSPTFGAIALAMLRREVLAGDPVTVAAEGGAVVARVSDLPFA